MGLKVIGAGFGRTGTNSLKLALEELGFGPCHHMHEISNNPSLLPDWVAAANGESVNWGEVFENFGSQVDWPGARYWRELADYFPDAKVVLSVRDPEKWYASIMNTIAVSFRTRREIGDVDRMALLEMAYETVGKQIFNERLDDCDYAIRVFNDHISQVQKEIASNRLLTFNSEEGWEPLCKFLKVPVPDTDFPNINSSKQYQKVNESRTIED